MSLTFDRQEVLSQLDERIKEHENFIPKLEEKFGTTKKEITSFWGYVIEFFRVGCSFHEELVFATAKDDLDNLFLLRKYVLKSVCDPVPLTQKQYQMVFLPATDYYNIYL